ncbi:hypothetical protein ACFX5K_00100 [Rickettsiales bacterium LUAb2]
METEDYVLHISDLKGSDTKGFNATVNALRAGSFINFTHHFEAELASFFTKCILEENNKKLDLSIAYKNLDIVKLKFIFDKVLAARKSQLEDIFTATKLEFKNLDVLDQKRYLLLYLYGDKLGGYQAISSMNIEELLKIDNYFNEISELLNKKVK